MNSNKTTARFIGALFLAVMVAWFIGYMLIDSVISAPDYLIQVYPNKTRVIIGVLIEIIEAAGVISIAVMLFPVLKKFNVNIARGYFGFRIIESLMLIVAALSALLMVSLSQEYINTGAPDASSFETLGTLFIIVRADWSTLILSVFYSFAAFMFYYVLYKTRLIPRFISVWGLLAAVLVLAGTVAERFVHAELMVGIISGAPMGLNELFLGVWLVVKGFNPSAAVSGSAR